MKRENIKFGYKLFVKPVGKKNLFILLIGLLSAASGIAGIYFPGTIINNLYPNPNTRTTVVMVALFCIIGLLTGSLITVFQRKIDYESLKVTTSIKEQLVKKQLGIQLLKMESPEYADDFNFGARCLDRNFYSAMSGVVISLISMIFLLVTSAMIIKEKNIVYIYIAGCIILLPSVYFAKNKISKNKYTEQQADNSERREMEAVQWNMLDLQYGQEVRIFGLTDFLTKKYNSCRNYVYSAIKKCCKENALYAILPATVFMAQMILAYCIAMQLYVAGNIEVGDFVMYVAAFLGTANAITKIAEEAVRVKAEGRYFNSLKKCFSYEVADSDKTEERSEKLKFESLEFKNVSFSYKGDDTYALMDVSLSIKEGDRIAIVGENGSGKTTFIKLLTGLYRPTSGEILLNGKDMALYKRKQIEDLLSPVFQDYALTYYTIKENIAFSDEIDEGRMETVLDEVGLLEKVCSLGKGIDTHVFYKLDNEGTELSGGEMQKVALARALYKNAPILILDEPTAALSPKAEQELYNKIWAMKDYRTVFLISHRLSSCCEAEKIIVFKEGKIEETGTHETLMEKGGYYNTLFSAQAKNYKE